MSNDEQNRQRNARMQQEFAEFENPRARYQAVLDRFWSERREAEAEERRLKRELDEFGLGLYDDDFHVPKTGKG